MAKKNLLCDICGIKTNEAHCEEIQFCPECYQQGQFYNPRAIIENWTIPKAKFDQIKKQIEEMYKKVLAKAVEYADIDGEIYDKGIVVGSLTALEKVLKLFD